MARWSRIVPYLPLVLVLAGVLCYVNTLEYPFLFDDVRVITGNRDIDRVLPILPRFLYEDPHAIVESGAADGGFPVMVQIRWLVNLSFKLNYALGGFTVTDYRATNLAIHIAAAWLLFGVMRRTLRLPRLTGRFGAAADRLAAATALLFVVHPLQTESVTYTCQRYESMMALCLLATLYGFIRAITSTTTLSRWTWSAAAVLVCVVGMGTKEMMAMAPLILLLYDRLLVGRTMPGRFRQRALLHTGCFAALAVFIVMVTRALALVKASGESISGDVSPWIYLATQTEVLLHYLRLSVWPAGQCLDYAWPLVSGWGEVWLPALVVAGAGLLTAWGVLRGRAWAFLPATCFLVLAPTSSLMPVADVAFEHRMYLPLGAVLAGIVMTLYRCLAGRPARGSAGPRVWLVPVLGAALALGTATHLRNRVYASQETMWRDVLRKQPGNYRQRVALFQALLDADRDTDAEEVIRKLIADTEAGFNRGDSASVHARDPFWHHGVAHCELGRLLRRRGEADRAIESLAVAVRALPEYAPAHHNIGLALAMLGRGDEARRAVNEALRLEPTRVKTRGLRAFLLARDGAYREAGHAYRDAIAMSPPPHHDLSLELAWLLATAPDATVRNGAEARELAEAVCRATDYRSVRALDTLAAALAEQGSFGDAYIRVQQALSLLETGAGAAPARGGLAGWGPSTDRARLLAHQQCYAARQPLRDPATGGHP